jgi:large repetitive protein
MRREKSVLNRGFTTIVMGALVLGLISACSLFNQTPVARIVASVVSGSSPLSVTFQAVLPNEAASYDPDGTIVTYGWDFGDGTTDSGATVQHTYTTLEAVKVFIVTLTITDDDGNSATATQTIEVNSDGSVSTGTGVPTARFTVNRFIGVDPLSVSFNATTSTAGSGSIVAYNWDFADGETATGSNPTHVFSPESGETTTYPATLFVWNSNDQVNTFQMDIIVIVPEVGNQDDAPIAEVTVTDPNIIYWFDAEASTPSLFEVKFDPRGSSADPGHSVDYFAWDFGDGSRQVETSDLEITHIYALSAPARTYVARLTVFDDSGLEDTAIVNITLINPQEDPDDDE